jgi:putative transcriptional regulator
LITCHPSEASLLSYATGAMPEALALVLATHLAQCVECQRTTAAVEAVGGALLDASPPEPLAPSALDPEALDRLLDREYEPPPVPPVLHAGLPAPLDRVPMGRWWPIGIGLRFRPLRVSGSAWGGLILGKPGQALPRHGHDGLELTCVLRGAFADTGRVYAAGDLAEPETDHDQPPVVVSTEPCLCVIASEGIRLRGLFGMAQRLVRL